MRASTAAARCARRARGGRARAGARPRAPARTARARPRRRSAIRVTSSRAGDLQARPAVVRKRGRGRAARRRRRGSRRGAAIARRFYGGRPPAALERRRRPRPARPPGTRRGWPRPRSRVRRLPSSSSQERLRSRPSTATAALREVLGAELGLPVPRRDADEVGLARPCPARSTASRKLATFLSVAELLQLDVGREVPDQRTLFTCRPPRCRSWQRSRRNGHASEPSSARATRRLACTLRALGVWRSLVARSVRVGEVPSSNLGTPIARGRPRGRPPKLPRARVDARRPCKASST